MRADCDDGAAYGRSIHALKDKLLDRKPSAPGVLREYLRRWITQAKGQVPMPFIVTDPFDIFREPSDYEQRREALLRELSRLFLREGHEKVQGSTKLPAELQSFMGRRR